MKRKKVGGGGGQGRCERRSEAFVKIQKNYCFFCVGFFFWGGGGGSGRVGGGGVVGGLEESGWM